MSCDWILAIPRIYSAEACATASLPSRFRSESNITFPRHVFRSYFARKSRCMALVMGLSQREQEAKNEFTSGSAEGLRLLHSDGCNALSSCTINGTKQAPRGQPHFEISHNKFNVAPETAWPCNAPKRENVEACRSNYGSEIEQRNFNGEEVDWRTTHLKSWPQGHLLICTLRRAST